MRTWMSPLLLLAACATGNDTDPAACLTGEHWTGGNSESPLMRPGHDCIACHTSEGEGPSYAAAGTVYAEYQQEDDCNGEDGVTVELTDADGTVFTATSNAAGNFFFPSGTTTIVAPYTARLLIDGEEVNKMVGPQTETNCAVCHTMEGASAAPGRVRIP